MPRHEYRSRPVTVTAVQIPDTVDELKTRIAEAFDADGEHLTIASVPVTTDVEGPQRLLSVTMTTVQGQLATALPGEWIAQEHDDATRFYPIADEAMVRRYVVRGRRPVDVGTLAVGGPVSVGTGPATDSPVSVSVLPVTGPVAGS